MAHTQYQVEAADGLQLHGEAWLPDEPRAVVVLLHGYAEHCGRYEHWASFLNERGYALEAFDHRGHGRSGGKRAQVASFDEYVADARLFGEQVCRRCKGRPVFLMGHSMGGTIATLLALQDQEAWSGLVLSSAALKLAGVPQWQQDLVALIASVVPDLPTIKIDSRVISRDSDVVQRYDSDPLNYRGGSRARWSAEFASGIGQARAAANQLELPLLVMYGAADELIDPAGSQALYEQAASLDKTLLRYEPCYHELLNEPEKGQIMADIVSWLDARQP